MRIYYIISGGSLWNTSRLLKLAICVTALRTAAAVNARHPASLLVRRAAVSLTSSVRALRIARKANN